jgi:hypothetical protein
MTVDETELHRRLRQLEKALQLMGGTHSLNDILALIETGNMQSFTHGSSWALTQVFEMPRKKVCEIFLAMGEIGELKELHAQILAFARERGCTLIRATAREGWREVARELGWPRARARLYVMEL